MPDYSNPRTPLTARRYVWDVTFIIGPPKSGANPSKDCSGTYDTQPDATVGSLLAGLKTLFSQQVGVPEKDITIVRWELREK